MTYTYLNSTALCTHTRINIHNTEKKVNINIFMKHYVVFEVMTKLNSFFN